jgi:hypothetical protein
LVPNSGFATVRSFAQFGEHLASRKTAVNSRSVVPINYDR